VVRFVIIGIGVILLLIAMMAFFIPIFHTGFTIPMANDLCTQDMVQWALLYTQATEALQACNMFKVATFAIYGISLIGIALIIVGAVKKSEKPRYTCGHCDFIGKTEEGLWDHYNEKHPDEKKW